MPGPPRRYAIGKPCPRCGMRLSVRAGTAVIRADGDHVSCRPCRARQMKKFNEKRAEKKLSVPETPRLRIVRPPKSWERALVESIYLAEDQLYCGAVVLIAPGRYESRAEAVGEAAALLSSLRLTELTELEEVEP